MVSKFGDDELRPLIRFNLKDGRLGRNEGGVELEAGLQSLWLDRQFAAMGIGEESRGK